MMLQNNSNLPQKLTKKSKGGAREKMIRNPIPESMGTVVGGITEPKPIKLAKIK